MSSAKRQTRRRADRDQQKQAELEQRMAAAVQNTPQPIIVNLDNCHVIVRDHPTETGTKELMFAHVTGGVVFRAKCGPELRREVATLLTAPAGIVVPTTTADTPAA